MREEFLNEIVHEEKYINEETFRIYFRYQKRSFLEKKLSKADKDKNDKIKYLIINELITLMEDINIKEITGNEYPKK